MDANHSVPARAAGTTPGRAYGRLLELLQALADSPAGQSAPQLAARLGMPRSSLFLMLQDCRERGYVESAGGLVRAGPRLVRLGFEIAGAFAVRRLARPVLESLARETGQDVYLGIRRGLAAIYVEVVEGAEAIHLNMARGSARPLHATAVGKLLLAHAPREVVAAVVGGGLPRVTARTIVDPERLRRELALIRAQGFATSEGEAIEGINAIAVPIFGRDGEIAGISMAQPGTPPFRDADLLIAKMRAAAARIERLGGGPTPVADTQS
ncbi:MAG: IclR family transcriptional regulator [Alphaproteobacteria bacterium]|nr:IclR family transcriptional regulator [Alphaproteobacteria bacterium]